MSSTSTSSFTGPEFSPTIPNGLSLYRLSSGPLIGVLYWWGTLSFDAYVQLAWVVIYALACASDFADGMIARRWPSQASEFGKWIDPISDKALVGSMIVLLFISGEMGWYEGFLLALIVFRELAVTRMRNGSASAIPVTFLSKSKTVVQMITFGVLFDGVYTNYLGQLATDALVADVGALFLATATIITCWTGVQHYRHWRKSQ